MFGIVLELQLQWAPGSKTTNQDVDKAGPHQAELAQTTLRSGRPTFDALVRFIILPQSNKNLEKFVA